MTLVFVNLYFYIGQRLSYEGHLCTVRFIGEVKGTKGDWLGVEWDDASRGKHDGIHESTNYFKCLSRQRTAASFIRPSRKRDPSRSFTEALKSKYAGDVSNIHTHKDDSTRSVVTAREGDSSIRISGKVAEEVGFDKIRRRQAELQELRIVILDGLQIHRPLSDLYRKTWATWKGDDAQTRLLVSSGRDLDIARTCPQTTELDLSRNLFEAWVEIASICQELPELRSLRCDGNRFSDLEMSSQETKYFKTMFRNIRSLGLSETLLSWSELTGIASTFTGLTTLVASANQLSRLDGTYMPQKITILTLENNDFTSLDDLAAVKLLPCLYRLNLRNNNISTIAPASTSMPVFQSTLQELDLSNNSISSWSFIDDLHTALPGLVSLRVSNNPLYANLNSPTGSPLTAEDGYTLTIARLPHLISLNYSAVSAKDRLNAETYYLSQIALELSLLPPSASEEDVLRKHPRWTQLCEEYGAPVVNRSGATRADPDALAARLLKVQIKVGASAQQHLQNPGVFATKGDPDTGGNELSTMGTVSIPKRYSVYSVQGLVGRLLGLAPAHVKLVWETGEPEVVGAREEITLEPWDSDEEDEAIDQAGTTTKLREVELMAGTRPLSTWVDGDEVVIRVEMA